MIVYTKYTEPNYNKYIEMKPENNNVDEWIGHTGDNFKNYNFNKRIYDIIKNKELNILEIGCGDGSAIEDFIKDGYNCIGLDIFPYWKKFNVGLWGRDDKNLSICDVGEEFYIYDNSEIVKFDLIYSFECFEHIHTDNIDTLANNIQNHSKTGTYLIFSASQRPDGVSHKTLRNKDWWINTFEKVGFENLDIDFGSDVIRFLSDSVYVYMRFK